MRKNDTFLFANYTTPAYCWYNNDSATNKATYGALYNWFAVNTGKLCPAGWHVPTDAEWTTLENYLMANGYNYDGTTTGNKYAKALASKSGWASSTGTGTVGNTDYPAKRNVTGFTALPGGTLSQGAFHVIGYRLVFWSSEYSAQSAWTRSINNVQNYVYRDYYNKIFGFSVRCLRDN